MAEPEKIKILAIEDSAADLRLLKEFLSENRDFNFDLVCAETLKKALAYLNGQHFNLVFLDLNLPDGQGLKNIETVKCACNSSAIIVLTGIEDEKLGLLSLQKGAQDYLSKGQVKNDSLLRSIRYSLQRKKTEDELKWSEQSKRILSESAAELLESMEPRKIIQKICEKTMSFLDCQLFFNFLSVSSKNKLFLNAYSGISEKEAKALEWLDFGTAVCGYVAQEGKSILSQDIQNTKEPRTDLVRGLGVYAYYCNPLFSGKETIGTISFGTKTRNSFSQNEISMMEATANLVSMAMLRKRSEDILKEERNKLEAVIENVSVGIAETDEKGGNIHSNTLFKKIWGSPRPQADQVSDYVKYKAWWVDSGKPVLPEEWASAVVIKTGKPVLGQMLEIERFSGERGFIINSAAPILDSEGKVRGSVVAITDITEQKKLEEALQRKTIEEQMILDSVPALVFYKDKKNRLLRVNKTFENLMGMPKKELEGKDLKDLFPVDQVKAFWKDDLEVIASGKPKRGIIESVQTPEGIKIVQTDKIPHFGPGQEVDGIIGFSVDITERKKAEEILKREKESLNAIFNVVNTGMLLIDENGMVKMINNTITLWIGKDFSKLPIKKPGNIIGCLHALNSTYGCGKTIHCSSCAIRKNFQHVLHTGEAIHNVEFKTLLYQEGKEVNVWLEINADPIELEGRRHVILSINNITVRKKAEEVLMRDKVTFEELVNEKTRQLMSAELKLAHIKRLSDIGTLAATVAHELRNPLAAIKMAAYNAQRKAQNPILDKHFSNIEIKLSESENIIDNLLFYSKIKIPHLAPINIHNILSTCIKDAKSRFPAFKVNIFRKDDAIKNLLLEADAVQMKEIFTNLLINSYDATGSKGGRITITAQIKGGNLKIAVKDNGAGIDKENLENIFQPFFSTKAKGTGLGLTVAQQVVKLHGGTIQIKSEKGEGTEVTVTLPLKQDGSA